MADMDSQDDLVQGLELSLEKVTRTLIPEMTTFGAIYYPEGNPNRTEAYLDWLCVQNPAGAAIAVVIRDRGTMVGLALLVPLVLDHAGKALQAYFAVNVLTHPDYRNRRLFSRIIDATKEFCSQNGTVLLGHPNAAALAGWTRKEMQFRSPLVPALAGLSLGVGRRVDVPSSKPDFVRVWERVLRALPESGGEAATIRRSTDFMWWRFFARPDRPYRLAVDQRKGGGIDGFFVTRSFRRGVALMVDHGAAVSGRGLVSCDRPAIVMLPQEQASARVAGVRAWRLPARKQMPFFATVFDGRNIDFSGITLAASDF